MSWPWSWAGYYFGVWEPIVKLQFRVRFVNMAIKRDALFGVLDQALISLSNLGIGFLLIKLTTKDSYGLYGIGFSIILLSVGSVNSLITTQMAVFAPEKEEKKQYCLSMLLSQYIILTPIWLTFLLVSAVLRYIGLISSEIFLYGVVLSVVILAATFHEFMRRYFYVDLKPSRVLQIDLVNVLLIFIIIIAAVINQVSLTHVEATIIYGVGAVIGGLTGLLYSGLLRKPSLIDVKSSLGESWLHGSWALAGTIVSWLQTQGYVAILSIFASAASIAEANAARLFLAPVGFISTGLVMVFMPRLAILKNEGNHQAVLSVSQKVLMIILFVIVVVVLSTLLVKDYVIKEFFPAEYSGIGGLILSWGGVFLAQAIRNNAAILLQIYKKFRVVTILNFLTAIGTCLLAFMLIKINGVEGSIQAISLGELSLSLMLWRAFYKYHFDNAPTS